MKWSIIPLGIFCSLLALPDLFDTSFLTQTALVQAHLISHEHCAPVEFQTSDKVTLAGLWKEDSNAGYNTIICTGFYPGKKEGMATMIHLVPENTNILFFDARGHGQSKGHFLSALHTYGLYEYLDIIGAIDFVHQQNTKPIIIFGLCAGAFHASRALIELSKQHKLDSCNIAGFIFDSGLTSLLEVIHIPAHHIKESVIPWLFKNNFYSNKTKQEVKKYIVVRLSSWLCSSLIQLISISIKPFYLWNEQKTTIYPHFNQIKCPILFIHSLDDTYCRIEHIQALAQITKNEYHWWINKPSKHASHHLIYPNEYKLQLVDFFSKLVDT